MRIIHNLFLLDSILPEDTGCAVLVLILWALLPHGGFLLPLHNEIQLIYGVTS